MRKFTHWFLFLWGGSDPLLITKRIRWCKKSSWWNFCLLPTGMFTPGMLHSTSKVNSSQLIWTQIQAFTWVPAQEPSAPPQYIMCLLSWHWGKKPSITIWQPLVEAKRSTSTIKDVFLRKDVLTKCACSSSPGTLGWLHTRWRHWSVPPRGCKQCHTHRKSKWTPPFCARGP